MRITKLEITNFQGLRHAALDVSAPVLLVAGHNGAGKSSLLDAIAMAFNGQPRRVSLKKEMDKLVTEGAKKGEAHVTFLDNGGDEQTAWVMLPTGKSAPLADSPFLPYVLDASLFAALDSKERRKVLFELSGASASPAEVGKRLESKGLDLKLFEKVKPLLRTGFPAAVEQAKAYASEARGAWKAITGENYGSEKAVDWAPELVATVVTDDQVAEAGKNLQQFEDDLAEAQQTLGASKQARQAADGRAQRITKLRDLVDLEPRRRNKLSTDEQNQDEWSEKVMAAELASSGSVPHQPLTCPHCQGAVDLQAGALVVHQPPEKIADAEAAKRLPEYREYLASAQRAVANSQRDLDECLAAAEQIKALETESADAPSAEAIANGEQAINELRQARDASRAKLVALQEAMEAAAQREASIAKAQAAHRDVVAWTGMADALSPTGIPAEILADAIGPVNELLQRLSGTAGWSPVQISADIDVTFGGRLYGLLSESERWRCDATLALTIATISGLRLALLDRLDVLDLPSRSQALTLLRAVTMDKEIDSVIVAGTLKEAMAKTPTWLQAVWIDAGQLADQQQQAAA
ncbi:TPA: AAA family ATPase [Pseudomonas aeruginosa]|uniref:AAA family ATPase n=1 Tax=Pseudomonas aeruginosa TaxID=287 RepID=UPI0010674540|nr:AAA family ATPase [Pseudomonas aeruginosa]EIU2641505.1 AAA family ATPase [Pseudomonas aeruginosa]EIU9549661.1 AAA family ATPase [Pseudomonas aeruginosa]EKO0510583.1 AAA family ATPase [Pseudomonas aeruginosa]EKT8500501.1 AAA family ATPase [Pseudomonas aeruginosa]EKU2929625.1 AAA family ATPase [Pseudomonas aeruginosa]